MTGFNRSSVALLFALALARAAPAAGQTSTQAPTRTPGTAAPDVTPPTLELRSEDLVADWFDADPATAAPGAVIVLGGSEGGLTGSRGIARRLAAASLPSLAVSYFGEPGQPARLDLIPVETVDRVLAWLDARPGPLGPVAVVGVSKGAELALLFASRTPAIKAVVAGVPSHVVWQGIDMTGAQTGPSWTVAGAPVAYVPYDLSKGFNGVYRLYVDSLASASPEAEIPVERIAGPILLVSGEADGLWPSTEMSRRIEQRLTANAFPHPMTHLAYPDAGHGVFGPPVRPDAPGLQASLPFMGGSVNGLVSGRADGWPRVVTFLRQALGAPE